MSIWIRHQTKKGDKLSSLLKQYKIKDKNVLLKFKDNKPVLKVLRSDEDLGKGRTVWVPDPKAIVYIVKAGNKTSVLEKAEFYKFDKAGQKAMEETVKAIKARFTNMIYIHDAILAQMNNGSPVAWVIRQLQTKKEPDRKTAAMLVKTLESAYKQKNYKSFASLCVKTDKCVVDYCNDVEAWRVGFVGGAKAAVIPLTVVKTIGVMCGTMAAVTVAAPATLTAGVLIGGTTSASVGLSYDIASQVSKAGFGIKTQSVGDIAKNMASNALAGAGGALLGGVIMKGATKVLASSMANRVFISKFADVLARTSKFNKIYEKQVLLVAKDIVAKNGGDLASVTKVISNTLPKAVVLEIIAEAVTKTLVRAGVGSFSKYIGASKKIQDAVTHMVKAGSNATKKMSNKALSELAGLELLDGKFHEEIYNTIVKNSLGNIEDEINRMIAAEVAKARI